MMAYFDKNGTEIKAGMFLRLEGGLVEKIYDTVDAFGNPDLGINASNDAYLKRHGLGEYAREFYPLSQFSLRDAEICEPEQAQEMRGLSM
jgi:hypothetical protein